MNFSVPKQGPTINRFVLDKSVDDSIVVRWPMQSLFGSFKFSRPIAENEYYNYFRDDVVYNR